MADAPATTIPAAAPVAPAAPPAAPPTPAPAPKPAPSPSPASSAPEMDFNTPIEYEDGKGGYIRTTYGELIQAREELQKLGDVNHVKDMLAAMGNDPAATERLLRKQLADIEAAKAKNTPAGDNEVAQLRAELAEIKAALGQSTRVTTTIENQQHEAIIENLLSKDQTRAHLPYLSAKPKVGARVAMEFVQAAKQYCRANNMEFNNQVLTQALARAEAKHRANLEPYGIDPGKVANPPANPAVSAVNNGPPNPANVVREPLDTPESLLRSRMPGTAYNPPAPVGSHVPEPGGATGGVPAGNGQPAGTRYSTSQFVDRLRANRAAGGGA